MTHPIPRSHAGLIALVCFALALAVLAAMLAGCEGKTEQRTHPQSLIVDDKGYIASATYYVPNIGPEHENECLYASDVNAGIFRWRPCAASGTEGVKVP